MVEPPVPPLRAAVDAVLEWDRVIARAQAEQLRALVAVTAARGRHDEFASDIVGAELRWSRRFARDRVGLAGVLVAHFPLVLAAMDEGVLDLARATVFAEVLGELDDGDIARLCAQELPEARYRTVGQLRARLEREVLAINPEATRDRHEKAKRNRDVRLTSQRDGMASLDLTMAADDAVAANFRIGQLARQLGSADGRSMDERCSDVARDLLLGRHPVKPTTGGEGPAVSLSVTLDAATLAGLAEEPGELAGYGPIPADLARDLAAAARSWQGLLIHPETGDLLDVSTTYRPNRSLDRLVKKRDKTCRFPGCRQPAMRCEVDHTIPWPTGATCRCNLACFCTHHHRLKHESDWQIYQPEPGLIVFITPHGRVLHTRGPGYGPRAPGEGTWPGTPEPHPERRCAHRLDKRYTLVEIILDIPERTAGEETIPF